MNPVRAVTEAVKTSFGAVALLGLILGSFAPIWAGVGIVWLRAPDQHQAHSPVMWIVLSLLLPTVWLAISHICDFVIKLVLAVLVGSSRTSEIIGESAADFTALALLGWCINITFFTTYAMSFLAAFIAYVIYRLFERFLDDENAGKAAEQ